MAEPTVVPFRPGVVMEFVKNLVVRMGGGSWQPVTWTFLHVGPTHVVLEVRFGSRWTVRRVERSRAVEIVTECQAEGQRVVFELIAGDA